MAIGTLSFLSWTGGISTAGFLNLFAAVIPKIGYQFSGEETGGNKYAGSRYDGKRGVAFSDPLAGLPQDAPGFDAMGATVSNQLGQFSFLLSLSNEDGLAQLYNGGTIQVATLRMEGHMHPSYFNGDLGFIICQYKLLKQLHTHLNADDTWAIDYGQDIEDAGPWNRSLERSACWFSKCEPQKLIKPLEEGRAPVRDHGMGNTGDFEKDPETGMPRWALIMNEPFEECL